MRQKIQAFVGAAVVMAMVTVPAARVDAAFIVYEGLVGGSGDVDNVLYQCDGNITGPDTTIQGCLNTDPTRFINFTSDTDLYSPAIGQARIEAFDGDGFDYLHISPEMGTFSKLQLNINASADGEVTFWAAPNGATGTTFDLSGGGENFFTIIGDDLTAAWFQTTAPVLALDVRQVRINLANGNGPGPDPIPEPTILGLFGLALLGAGVARRRARQ
jgi:hypothetical protein